MRLKYIIYPLAIIALMVMLNGCEKFTEGFNTSTVAALDASSQQLFSGAQLGYMQTFEGGLARIAAIITQQATGAERQYGAYQVYTLTSQDFINDWATAYANCFANLKLTEKKAAASAQRNLLGAVQVTEGLEMGTLTALWGDVPYTQAAQAPLINQPVYDPQTAVYDSVQALLSRGIANLTPPVDKTLSTDIFSSANSLTSWTRLGYSAKARYYMHVARLQSYSAASLNNVITNGLLGIIATDGTQDVSFIHGSNEGEDENLWYSFLVDDRSGYMDASVTFAEPMLYYRDVDGKSNDSARFAYYYYNAGYWDLNYYTPNGAFQSGNTYPAFRASETLLLIAEAYYRQGDAADALTYLNNARTYANNVFGSNLAPFVAGDLPGASLLQAIINEQYLALAFQLEVFDFARRVNYHFTYKDSTGVMHSMTPTDQSSVFPQRFLYSQDEITANPHVPVTTLKEVTTVNSTAVSGGY
ncbi:MAG: SusD/RagB family nutrient-binding outer membrane lipoprotein [Bacteroidota bacterium]